MQSIILGIIQGITEWLPISSSGHLVLAKHIMDIEKNVAFDVGLHLASLLVIILVYRKDILQIARGMLQKDEESLHTVRNIILATIPIALAGLFLEDTITSYFTVDTVSRGLLLTAAFLILSIYPKKKEKSMTLVFALVIGAVQAIALLPGVSRSGVTISAALMLGVRRQEAARFSFFMAMPAILGAAILKLPEAASVHMPSLIIAMLTTFVAGYISLKLLLTIIEKNLFRYFAIYCIILALII